MATSTISDHGQGFVWHNPCRQPLRPATTSPSFYPHQNAKSRYAEVPNLKNRNQLHYLLPGREYFSLPSTPPRGNELSRKSSKSNCRAIKSSTIAETWDRTMRHDENANRFLPEWYIEPCFEVLSMPEQDQHNEINLNSAPLDHSQKREMYCHDSSLDDCEFSDESQPVDLDDCFTLNPSSDEVSKLNSLGQGQSRFLSLFKHNEDESSCCSSSSLSEKYEDVLETSITSATGDVSMSEENIYECEIADGIEAVRKGLARLLSIPTEGSFTCQQLLNHENSEVREQNHTDTKPSSGGSRLLKLFHSSGLKPEDENTWNQDSPLCISSLWKSDSSLANGATNFSSEASSMRNSPSVFFDEVCSSPTNLGVPNIASISPTAPLHFKIPNCQIAEGFPVQSDPALNSSTSSRFFTACDLSNEETEIEAALERGDGFFTNDDYHGNDALQVDDAIWSPCMTDVPGFNEFSEDAIKLDSVSPMTLKQIAENAANDIIDWLDTWLNHCADAGTHEISTEDFTDSLMNLEEKQKIENQSVQATALNLYRMFDKEVDDHALEKILNMAEEDILSDTDCPDDGILAHLAQSPGILDFLLENDSQEENSDDDQTKTKFSGSSLHFLLNSRASNIYDSYLLFPDLMHFANPMKNFNQSECKDLDGSSLFSQLFSTSLDWMGNLDALESTKPDPWEHTLQSLSPKTPFTPTGNLSESLYSMERKHSITLEQLCNLAAIAASIESRGIDHSSLTSTDFFVQYLQSQLGYFENIAFFKSPSLKNDLIHEKSDDHNWNNDCGRLYRPVPLFPLQFINRLSLTNSSAHEGKEQENLLFSPDTHFRPITPGPEEKSNSQTLSPPKRSRVESVPDDIDDELVAIHEGADHSKLVELYAQMQLKQQLAAEQKQNFPQLVTVDESGRADEENAYEEKHLSHGHSDDVADYALDCAAEAAATVAVNALGSADPAEALAILEEWHWKEKSHDEDSLLKTTFPDLGYFETAHGFLQNDADSDAAFQQPPVLEDDSKGQVIHPWSIEDGTCVDQNFKYDSLKKIWIRSVASHSEDESDADSSHLDFHSDLLEKSSLTVESRQTLHSEQGAGQEEIGIAPTDYNCISLWKSSFTDKDEIVSPIAETSGMLITDQVSHMSPKWSLNIFLCFTTDHMHMLP